MPTIPFPLGFKGSRDLPETNETLLNLFNIGDNKLLQRRGITQLNTTSKVARGNFEWNGFLYQVVSESLIKITNVATGAFNTIGTVDGSSPIQTAVGFNDVVILAPGENIYTLSKSTDIVTITSVGNGVASLAVFNHAGTQPNANTDTVEISGFVTNSAYNTFGSIVTIAIAAITSTAIASVADSIPNPGTASFTHAGTSPALGQEVTLSGFAVETTYNATGTVTLTTATTFEVSTIAFTATDTGNYVGSAAFSIAFKIFGSNETTGQFVNTLTDITNNTNIVPSRDVAHIDGRFVYIPFDGSPAFFSDVGAAGTVQAASFFDAEVLPDINIGVFVLRNTLYIAGTDSIEAFQNTGATPNPFVRIPGALIENGLIGGLQDYNINDSPTFLFIGRKTRNNASIFAVGAGKAFEISNERIDRLLETYTDTELSEAIPGRIVIDGYDIATFTLRRDSFGYLNGNWFLLDTVFSGTSRPWGGGFIAQFEGKYYTAFDDKIGVFDNVNTDYGERITKIIGGGATQENGDYIKVQNLTLGISQGFNSAIGSVALRTSDTNVQFGPEIFINLGSIGEYCKKLRWQPSGGLGLYLGFFGYEIYSTEDINMSADQLISDFI